MLPAAVVGGQLRHDDTIQSDCPRISRELANQLIGAITRLAKTQDPALCRHSSRHVEQRHHGGGIVRKVDEHAAAVQFVQIAAARVLVLHHRRQTLPDILETHAQRMRQRRGAERVGDVVPRGTAQRNRNLVAATNHDAPAALQLDEFVAIEHECQSTVVCVGHDRFVLRIKAEPYDFARVLLRLL